MTILLRPVDEDDSPIVTGDNDTGTWILPPFGDYSAFGVIHVSDFVDLSTVTQIDLWVAHFSPVDPDSTSVFGPKTDTVDDFGYQFQFAGPLVQDKLIAFDGGSGIFDPLLYGTVRLNARNTDFGSTDIVPRVSDWWLTLETSAAVSTILRVFPREDNAGAGRIFPRSSQQSTNRTVGSYY